MGVPEDRLIYVAVSRGPTWIARATGIPRGLVGRISQGIASLPKGLYKTVRNLYQREAYANMRSAGFSSDQARRFSWYRPSGVIERIAHVQAMIQELAVAATGMEMAKLEADGVFVDAEDLYADMYEKVTEGFRMSHRPFEEWEKYKKAYG